MAALGHFDQFPPPGLNGRCPFSLPTSAGASGKTACSEDDRRRRVREPSAAEFITKPVDFDQLKVQLRELRAPRLEFNVPAFPAMPCDGDLCRDAVAFPHAQGDPRLQQSSRLLHQIGNFQKARCQ
jgi:hypothetical protein